MAPKSKAKAKVKAKAPSNPFDLSEKDLGLQEGVLAAFQKWDANGDGTISLPEMKEVLIAIGVPEDDVPKLFSLADTNKDSKIDYEEFLCWSFAVAPKQARQPRSETAMEMLPERSAALIGGHPDMTVMPLPADRKVFVTCKLAAPVTPALDFTISVDPSTRLAEIAARICENHGGSIKDPVLCVNRFHPEEVRSYDATFDELGVRGGTCVVYYDYTAEGGALLIDGRIDS